MKKLKKTRKYEADGRIFNTFKELKDYVYFNTLKETKKVGYELDEDVITKRYVFTKQERRLICVKTYDKDLEEREKWKEKQLKLFEHENSFNCFSFQLRSCTLFLLVLLVTL